MKKLGMSLGMRLLGVKELLDAYKESEDEVRKNGLWSTAVKRLNLSINVHPDQLNHIPVEGPLVIVSNHPFGGADGIILSYLVEQRRKDFKVFVTNMLSEQLPAAKSHFLDVELYSKDRANKSRNKESLNAAIDYVKNGGALIIFPAGTPSQAPTPFSEAIDKQWKLGASKIIHESNAPVVPVFFEGQNSAFFQGVGILFSGIKTARTLLLAKELLKRRNVDTTVRIGSPIPYSRLSHLSGPELLKLLRSRVYILKNIKKEDNKKLTEIAKKLLPYKLRKSTVVHDIIDKIPTTKISSFLSSYIAKNPEALLVDSKKYKVYLVNGAEASEDFLLELGRLREITFRAVGEGTGKRCDLDEHDSIYHHLIVWNDDKQWISGSYRLGLTPFVLPKRGINGFYCKPFFNLDQNFFNKMEDAVELGRSFVRKEEQSQWILFFLWKGLAQFFHDNPNYKHMFGSVSVSNDYSDVSRQLIAKFFLKNNGPTEDLKGLVRSEIPFEMSDSEAVDLILNNLQTSEELAKLVGDIEEDNKQLPVLVYRYAQLGAKYLDFAVDPDFANTLDGFIVVKIGDIPQDQIKKYLSESQISHFYSARN